MQEVPHVVEHGKLLGQHLARGQQSQDDERLVRSEELKPGREVDGVGGARKEGHDEERQIRVDAARKRQAPWQSAGHANFPATLTSPNSLLAQGLTSSGRDRT